MAQRTVRDYREYITERARWGFSHWAADYREHTRQQHEQTLRKRQALFAARCAVDLYLHHATLSQAWPHPLIHNALTLTPI